MKVTQTATILILLFAWSALGARAAIGDETPPAKSGNLNVTPGGPSATELTQQGWYYWKKGEMDEAIEKFKDALKLTPKSENALNGLGWASFQSGNASEAIKAFEELLAINPRHPAALNGLGQIYLSQRKYDKAETWLLKAAPKAPAAWNALARLYLLQEKFDKAQKWAQKVVSSGQADDTVKQMLQAAKDKHLSDELRQMIEPPEVQSEADDASADKE